MISRLPLRRALAPYFEFESLQSHHFPFAGWLTSPNNPAMDLNTTVTAGLVRAAQAAPVLAAASIFWFAARWLFERTHSFQRDEELAVHSNKAYGTYYSAFLTATGLALAGTLFGKGMETTVLTAVGKASAEAALVVVLMWLSIMVHDRALFSKFNIEKEVGEDRNLGAAFCLGGSLIASGLIVNGALIGFSPNLPTALRDIAVYWALGQVILLVGVWVYQRITKFDLHQLIAYDDNAAVGLSFAGFLISLGMVVRASLIGSGIASLPLEIAQTLTFALLGMAALAIVRLLIDLIMLPKADLNLEISMDRNLAAAVLAASVYLTAAFLLAMILQR